MPPMRISAHHRAVDAQSIIIIIIVMFKFKCLNVQPWKIFPATQESARDSKHISYRVSVCPCVSVSEFETTRSQVTRDLTTTERVVLSEII